MRIKMKGTLSAILLLGILFQAHSADIIKNEDCLECHSDKTLNKTNKDGRVISLYVDESIIKSSIHKTNSCYSCHSDITKKHPDDEIPAKPVTCGKCHPEHYESYKGSIHNIVKEKGEEGAPDCKDCHGTHNILPPTNPKSPLHFSNLSGLCGECHPEAQRDVKISVHGKSAAEGHREAATCIDCHYEHRITKLKDATSKEIAENVCAKCHSSEKINTKFRIPSDRVKTFLESYHGLASHLGSTRAAHCASCHGYHKVLPSTNPESTINPKNLVATCGKCHPGASEKFASGKIHTDLGSYSNIGEKVNFWVRKIYIFLIIITISAMFIHNFLFWIKKAIIYLKSSDRTIERLTKQLRIQHFILMISFIYLAISGFALKFPDSWLSVLLGSSEAFRRVSHRVAGVVLVALGMYHVIFIFAAQEGRRLLKDMLPKFKDFRDIFDTIKYFLGRGEKPSFDRFGYVEKMEYWAVVWGTIIMGLTGFIVWFKLQFTQIFPRWIIDVAITIHYYEAILACLAIIVWHFYHVIFDPDVYPMNWAWLDGKISEKYYREKHARQTHTASEEKQDLNKPNQATEEDKAN
ncbi:MAG: cytochrome b/b6 domain-containing protein [Verrucomicrobiia bacterium]